MSDATTHTSAVAASRSGPSPSGLRADLVARTRMLATFLMIPRVEIVEMLARAGFDAMIVDLEHAAVDIGDLPPLAAAAQGSRMRAIARLSSNSPAEIAKVLDTGVDGLLVPHVATAGEAARVVSAGRFAPAGDRSINPYVRATAYGWGDGSGRDAANRRTALIVMLEGSGAIAEVDSICAVDGVDAVFIGPVDLSASLGVPGEPEHPTVVDAVRGVLGRAAARGAATGIYAPTPDAAARWFNVGASLVALSADVAMAVGSFAATRDAALALLTDGMGSPAP